jgi:hypothetical protein
MSFQEPQEQKTEKMMSDNTPDEEQISDSNNVEETPEEAKAHEYVTGLRLFIILAAVTLVFFLLMLDMSIVTNVGPTTSQTRNFLTDHWEILRLYQPSPVTFTRLMILDGMEAYIPSHGGCRPLLRL